MRTLCVLLLLLVTTALLHADAYTVREITEAVRDGYIPIGATRGHARMELVNCTLKYIDKNGDRCIDSHEMDAARVWLLDPFELTFAKGTPTIIHDCDRNGDRCISLADFIASNTTCLHTPDDIDRFYNYICIRAANKTMTALCLTRCENNRNTTCFRNCTANGTVEDHTHAGHTHRFSVSELDTAELSLANLEELIKMNRDEGYRLRTKLRDEMDLPGADIARIERDMGESTEWYTQQELLIRRSVEANVRRVREAVEQQAKTMEESIRERL